MSKTTSCRDVGVDCDFTARGNTEKELFDLCERHGKKDRNVESIPRELKEKMRQYIREE